MGGKVARAGGMEALGSAGAGEGLAPTLPGGLVVRIRRSHRRGPGSIPGQGKLSFFQRLHSHKSLSCCPDRNCILLKGPVQNISAQSF